MIQLVDARFKNFRLLRDVAIEFARDEESPVTVIRAENGSGKTTLLTALTWGLFGDEALPSKRATYRLHPIGWDPAVDGERCEVTARIRFIATDDESGESVEYQLLRSAIELVKGNGQHLPQPSTLVLMKQTRAGHEPVPNPVAFISKRVLPPSLKDVFFIDGDRALAFIEASDERSARRERVEAAVRQLLGLDLLELADIHVDKARRDAMRGLKEDAQGTTLFDLSTDEEQLTNRIADLQEQKTQLERDRTASDGRLVRARETLQEVLASGGADRLKLSSQVADAERQLASERTHYQELVKTLRKQLNSTALVYGLAEPAVRKAAARLRELEEQKVIPDTLPDIVAERLDRGSCICGADVSPGTDGHEVLCRLLQDAQRLGEHHEVLMHLNSAAMRRVVEADSRERSWLAAIHEAQAALAHSMQLITDKEKEAGELRERVRKIPERDVATAEKLVTDEEHEVKRLIGEIGRTEGTLRTLEQQLDRVTAARLDAQKKELKHLRRLAEETAAKDLLAVIRGTMASLQRDTVREVSAAMNTIFMKMIVEDAEAGGVIQRAELTPDHDIVVHGPSGSRLDPVRDLSGAQRRALTLAFILSLVSVSGVRAPNVVDTPLGMTSGAVRRAILRYSAENSTQLVLFLTHSEIRGVEDLLDSFVGRTYTMTNTDHYPARVKNPPPRGRAETLVCECDYRSYCEVCEVTEVV